MKQTDAIKALLLATLEEISADPIKFAVNPGKDFTRNRKLGFRTTCLCFSQCSIFLAQQSWLI